MTIAEQNLGFCCQEKQKNDRKVRNGEKVKMKLPEAINGEKPYIDEFKNRINLIKKNRKSDLDEREKKIRSTVFKDSVRDIPFVSYNPHTAVQLLRSTEREKLYLDALNCNDNKTILIFDNDINNNNNNNNNNDRNNDKNININSIKSLNTDNINLKHSDERKYLKTIKLAQNGDEKVLYDYFLQTDNDRR